ncbi:uncharacterized protein LOC114605315 isoform X3 [Podarcis muralis]
MAERGRSGAALPDEEVLALAWVYLVALALSLLGSGSIVAASLLRRRCCQDQLCPLFLLSLADLLGASALLSAAAIQLLPPRLFVSAYQACPYLQMLGLMFYAVSLLMVVVYAYEVKRALGGWREAPSSALLQEESGRFNERLRINLPRLLAWLLPFLVFVVLLVIRGSSLRDVAPWAFPPLALQAGNGSRGSHGLYCSSCLVLIRHSQDTCYKYTGRDDSGKEVKIFFLVFVSLVVACCTVHQTCISVPSVLPHLQHRFVFVLYILAILVGVKYHLLNILIRFPLNTSQTVNFQFFLRSSSHAVNGFPNI